MKKMIVLLSLLLGISNSIAAQSLSEDMQKTVDACIALREAAASGSITELKDARKEMGLCDVVNFVKLRFNSGEQISLDGHFVFDTEFVDSLIVNRGAYKFAQRYADKSRKRASSTSGKTFIKTCCVKASESVTYSFTSKKRHELAVVAEHGGLITLRIHDVTHNKWYNDTYMEKEGLPYRIQVFDLPVNENSTIEVEIINTTEKDISFVVISN